MIAIQKVFMLFALLGAVMAAPEEEQTRPKRLRHRGLIKISNNPQPEDINRVAMEFGEEERILEEEEIMRELQLSRELQSVRIGVDAARGDIFG